MTHNNYVDVAFLLAAFSFLMLPYYLDLIDNGEYRKANSVGFLALLLLVIAIVTALASQSLPS